MHVSLYTHMEHEMYPCFFDLWIEFYHGRLDKAPGASELRLRWFGGANDPNTVYVERKTYMENFVSNEERFKVRYIIYSTKG
jgi:SPX domain protein involved in polyphosphate accumulation